MKPDRPQHDLDRRLRDVLHSRELSIEPDANLLDRVHAGARRRQHRHRVATSGLAAVAVIAVAATGVALRPSHHPATKVAGGVSQTPTATALRGAVLASPSLAFGSAKELASPVPTSLPSAPASLPAATVATIPAGGSPPAGFVPMSVTATTANGNTFWVLGHAPCEAGTCTALAKTTDGGKTFTEVGAPPSALVADDPGNADVFGTNTISDVRFVDGNDGWAYGGGFWTTTDGGQTWSSIPISGAVQQFAVASGRAWAVVFSGAPADTGPTYHVYSATYPGGTWSAVGSIGALGPDEPKLAVQGGSVTVIGTDLTTGARETLIATGGTTSFTKTSDAPCDAATGDPLSPTANGLWLVCSSTTTLAHGVYFSPDFGSSWKTASSTSTEVAPAIGAVNEKFAIVPDRGKLIRVGVDGSTASVSTPKVLPSTTWSFIGFTNPTTGFTIPIVNDTRQLWRTTDGGAHWSVVKF